MANYTKPGHRSLRKGRKSIHGKAYFITINTLRREKILLCGSYFNLIKDTLFWLENNGYIHLNCFVLMPDHIHFVFELIGNKNLGEIVKSFKIFTTKKSRETGLREGKLWERAFFDHRIRTNGRFKQIIYYCYNNPAKFLKESELNDYPFWYCKPGIWNEIEKELDYFRKLELEGDGFTPKQMMSGS